VNKKRIAVLISGSGSNLQALIDACAEPGYPAEIVLVLSNRETAYGLSRAREKNIPTHVISHKAYPSRETFDEAMDTVLRAHNVELVCLAGFMRVLSAAFVEKWQGKMINIHPSLLPKHKGLHTHQRAIDAGDTEAGCTVHWVATEVDGGEIILQARVPVLPDDTEDSLAARVLSEEHIIYPQALVRVIKESV